MIESSTKIALKRRKWDANWRAFSKEKIEALLCSPLTPCGAASIPSECECLYGGLVLRSMGASTLSASTFSGAVRAADRHWCRWVGGGHGLCEEDLLLLLSILLEVTICPAK